MKKAGEDGHQNHPSQLFFHFTPLITIVNAVYFLPSNAETFIYLETRRITLHFRSVQQTDNHFSAPHNRRLLDEGTIQVNIKFIDSPHIGNNADKLPRLVSLQRIAASQPLLPLFHEVSLVLDQCVKHINKSLIKHPIVNMFIIAALPSLHFILRAALPNNSSQAVVRGIPDSPAKSPAAQTADHPAGKRVFQRGVLKHLNTVLQNVCLPALHLQLRRFPHFLIDNRRVGVFVLW